MLGANVTNSVVDGQTVGQTYSCTPLPQGEVELVAGLVKYPQVVQEENLMGGQTDQGVHNIPTLKSGDKNLDTPSYLQLCMIMGEGRGFEVCVTGSSHICQGIILKISLCVTNMYTMKICTWLFLNQKLILTMLQHFKSVLFQESLL